MLLPLATSGCIIPEDNFWHSVLLYNNRPNLVNNRLIGACTLYFYEVNFSSKSVTNVYELFNTSSILYELRKIDLLVKENLSNLVRNLLEPYDKNVLLKETNIDVFNTQNTGLYVTVKLLLSKTKTYKDCIEIGIFNKDKSLATFIAVHKDHKQLLAPAFQYHVELTSSGHMRVTVENFEDADSNSAEWLADKLFLKLVKWANEDNQHIGTFKTSLSLISIDKYTKLYRELKEKYGKKMVEIWPENTDPLKFVYEDIAIATYLICMWNELTSDHKPNFVDLGCGNGLLVYILQEEGYHGVGIDVRKRKIWDIYPTYVNLREKTIEPSEDLPFPDVDWFIGNHSDELTPWIPVISSKSNYRANFFLLPCCSYDFDGRKYSRMNTSKSQYNDYLEYVEQICKICGFIVKRDKLRIPSTKKICLISTGRNYKEEEYKNVNESVSIYIKDRCKSIKKSNSNGSFIVRSAIEPVRNCTKLDQELISRIIKLIMDRLLKEENFVKKTDNNEGHWNAGGSLSFPDIVKCINQSDLKLLKKECGGIQTLMRNHRYIFDLNNGRIKLRIPLELKDVDKYKMKPCWFLKNHPQGCIHDSIHCAYKHTE